MNLIKNQNKETFAHHRRQLEELLGDHTEARILSSQTRISQHMLNFLLLARTSDGAPRSSDSAVMKRVLKFRLATLPKIKGHRARRFLITAKGRRVFDALNAIHGFYLVDVLESNNRGDEDGTSA